VAFTLNKRGIYLRFTPKPMRDPEDPSVWTIDPRNFETWLSLGPEGDTIPTKDGQITRDSILKTQLLGAGYYENVHIGPAQNALKREIKRLTDAIELGIEHHNVLQRIRDDAVLKVAKAAGEVAGVALAITGIPGLVRGGVRLVAGEGAVGAAEVGAAEVKYIDGYIKSAGHGADELSAVRAMKGPKGSVAGA